MRLIGLLAASSALAVTGCSSLPSGETESATSIIASAAQCAGIDATFLGATKADARWVEADAAASLPAYCEVKATLAPVEGSSIGVVYRLPQNWNGRLLGIGGGGWAGNITLQAASSGLAAGYVTAQTDGGHPGASPWDNLWAENPVSVDDFAWRAVHEMTVAGKRLVSDYYGRAHERAYFQGCSTGGRMGLMAAQKFPDDFDAISAGAPVHTLQVQTSATMRSNLFGKPDAAFNDDLLALVNRSVLKACDAKDGVSDGVINEPSSCGWDPGELACKAGDAPGSCLSPVQVDTLRTLYSGIRAPDGEWAMYPLSKGGETSWKAFMATDGAPLSTAMTGGLFTLGKPLFGEAQFDFSKFKPADATRARSSVFAQTYEAKNPDLSRFVERGGKLLMWIGENDQGSVPAAASAYVASAYAHDARASDGLRLFVLPGVPHCRGGSGADQIDIFATLDGWIDSGRAPDALVATGSASGITRKACAWPKIARYRGSGDANDPDSWECADRAS